jgi:hypothetical protein
MRLPLISMKGKTITPLPKISVAIQNAIDNNTTLEQLVRAGRLQVAMSDGIVDTLELRNLFNSRQFC